jgi:hypothetical protein
MRWDWLQTAIDTIRRNDHRNRQAMIAVKGATILLRIDWLSGLIGALLW